MRVTEGGYIRKKYKAIWKNVIFYPPAAHLPTPAKIAIQTKPLPKKKKKPNTPTRFIHCFTLSFIDCCIFRFVCNFFTIF